MPHSLVRVIKQSKPFRSLEQEVNLSIHRASAQLLEPFAQFLKTAAKLTVSQYNMLRILRGAHPSRLPSSEISNRMVTRDPDITRLVDRLGDRGLVDRERNPRDRRVVEVGITKEGLAVLKKLDDSVEEYPKTALGHLGPERLEQLCTLLDAIITTPITFPKPKK